MAFVCRTVSEEDLDQIYALEEADKVLPFLGKREYRTPIESHCRITIDAERKMLLLDLPVLHRGDHWGKRLFVKDGEVVIFDGKIDYAVLYLSPSLIPVFDHISLFIREALEHAVADAYIGKDYGCPITENDKKVIANAEFICPELDNLRPINKEKAQALDWIFSQAFPQHTPPRLAGYRDVRNAEKWFYNFMLSSIRAPMLKDATRRFMSAPDLTWREKLIINRFHRTEAKLIREKLPNSTEKEEFKSRVLFAYRGDNGPLMRSCAENIPSNVANRRKLKRELLLVANLLNIKSKGIDTKKYELIPGSMFMSLMMSISSETNKYNQLRQDKVNLQKEIDKLAASYVEREFYKLFTHCETSRIKLKVSESLDTRQDESEMLLGRWYMYADQVVYFDKNHIDTSEDKSPFLLGEEINHRKQKYPYRIINSSDHGIIIELTIDTPARVLFRKYVRRTGPQEITRRYFIYFSDSYKSVTLVRERPTRLWKLSQSTH